MMRRRVVILTIATAVTLFTLLTPLAAQAAATGDKVTRTALRQLGVPYVYGGATPSGFDCSGFTMWAFQSFGVELAHNAEAQRAANNGVPVARKRLHPGDLVYFGTPAHHVGVYVGNGRYVHAPHTGAVVSIDRLAGSTEYAGARRFLKAPAGKRPTGRYVLLVALWLRTADPADGGLDPATTDTAAFAKRTYGLLGVRLPVILADQAALERGREIALENLRKGDLVFFGVSAIDLREVGIYAGGAKIVHRADDGTFRLDPLPGDFVSARRLLPATY